MRITGETLSSIWPGKRRKTGQRWQVVTLA
jgi:hypothetical protein